MKNRITIALIPVLVLIVGVLILAGFGLVDWSRKIDLGQILNIFTMLILVIITALYAYSTSEQAEASVKMAEEMREQRVMASRPVIIQKAMPEIINDVPLGHFSHFEVYNAGNGPAIELEISLLNKEKSLISAHRETFLMASKSLILGSPYGGRGTPFDLADLDESNYYFVCEYQGIFSRGSKKQTWYQTWLPFRTSGHGRRNISVISGELESREVLENERIDSFSSRSKPR